MLLQHHILTLLLPDQERVRTAGMGYYVVEKLGLVSLGWPPPEIKYPAAAGRPRLLSPCGTPALNCVSGHQLHLEIDVDGDAMLVVLAHCNCAAESSCFVCLAVSLSVLK